MQRERAHLIRPHLTGLGLQPGRDVGKQRAVLAFDRANLQLQARRVRLTAVRGQQEVPFLQTE